MKTNTIFYIATPFFLALCSLLCEFIAENGYNPELDTTVLFLMRALTLLIALTSIVMCFTKWKDKSGAIITSLNGAAMMVALDYYMNWGNPDGDNILWCLPMITLVYLMKSKAATK